MAIVYKQLGKLDELKERWEKTNYTPPKQGIQLSFNCHEIK